MLRKALSLLVLSLTLTGPVRADAVVDWNAIASEVISAGGRPGPSTLVDFAVVHAAIYDAVQAIERRYRPYHVEISGAVGTPAVAAAKAARDVLVHRFPAQAAAIETRYQQYLTQKGLSANDPGVEVGAQAAAGIIALRANDGAFPTTPVTPFVGSNAIGLWRPTPSFITGSPAAFASMAAPWLARVTPFAVKSADQFRAKRPPELTSDEYARDYAEVKAVGSATGSTRTEEQTAVAYFWADNTPIQWHRALRSVATRYVHDIAESSRLFALASFASADAIITCWETKIHYNYWRPVTAIPLGAEDGNPLTVPDPDWKPLINTPNYPEYSSGANSVSGAFTAAMELFFGTDEMTFTVTSNTPNLAPDKRSRTYARFSDAAEEVVDARIYLGLHFRFADTAAREAGSRIAKWTFTHVLKPYGEDVSNKVEYRN